MGFFRAMLLYSIYCEHGHSEGWVHILFPLQDPSFVSSSCQECEHYLWPESQAVFFYPVHHRSNKNVVNSAVSDLRVRV